MCGAVWIDRMVSHYFDSQIFLIVLQHCSLLVQGHAEQALPPGGEASRELCGVVCTLVLCDDLTLMRSSNTRVLKQNLHRHQKRCPTTVKSDFKVSSQGPMQYIQLEIITNDIQCLLSYRYVCFQSIQLEANLIARLCSSQDNKGTFYRLF